MSFKELIEAKSCGFELCLRLFGPLVRNQHVGKTPRDFRIATRASRPHDRSHPRDPVRSRPAAPRAARRSRRLPPRETARPWRRSRLQTGSPESLVRARASSRFDPIRGNPCLAGAQTARAGSRNSQPSGPPAALMVVAMVQLCLACPPFMTHGARVAARSAPAPSRRSFADLCMRS
jgi:hypothetical protein